MIKKNKTILFIPESGIYPFLRGLSVLGQASKENGNDVFITRCTGEMILCPMMVMHRCAYDSIEKTNICSKCLLLVNKVIKEYNFIPIDLSSLINNNMINEVNSLVKNSDDNLDKIVFKGFPVGKIVQYDFILETKYPYYSPLINEHREIYAAYIRNTALTILLTEAICDKYNATLFLTFNEYAQCQGVRYVCVQKGVRRMALTYPVHYNIDFSRFSLWESTCENWRYSHCLRWNDGKDFPISEYHVIECWKDAIFRIFETGSHIFSNIKQGNTSDIYSKLGLDPNKKTIIAFTSSNDERISVTIGMKIWKEELPTKDAFIDQIEWLKFLNEYSEKRKDIQIVIRIHPREGVKQFGINSKNLQNLKSIFKKDTQNFIIIWPDNPISSYDLMELADVGLVQWSLMGQELARLGTPVLSYTENLFYPDDGFIQVASTKEKYKLRLDSILNMEYTWEHLLKSIRFYHWRIFLTSLDLSDSVSNTANIYTWPKVQKEKSKVINQILDGQIDLITYNINEWKKNISDDSYRKESEAVLCGIRYYLDKVFYPPSQLNIFKKLIVFGNKVIIKIFNKEINLSNNKIFYDYNLEYFTDISKIVEYKIRTKKDKNIRIIVANKNNLVFIHKGKIVTRKSPMIARLAKLHQSYLDRTSIPNQL